MSAPATNHRPSPSDDVTDEQLRAQLDKAKAWAKWKPIEWSDELPPPPDWLVSGLIERGTVTVFAGDTGAVKSMLNLDLAAAMVQGREWIGRSVESARVLYVDNENPAGVVRRRGWALGLRPEHAERLAYFNRQSIRLDDPAGVAGLGGLLAGEDGGGGFDVLIVDTLLASQGGEVNSNTEIANLLDGLRGLAERTGATVIVLHHQRKPGEDGGADTSLATMGARYIVGGADNLITVSKRDDLAEVEEPEERDAILERAGVAEVPEGHHLLRSTFTLRTGTQVKGRDGELSRTELIEVASERNIRGQTLWLKVNNLGAVEDDGTRQSTLAAEVGRVVWEAGEAEVRWGFVADILGVDANDGTLGRARREAIKAGWVAHALKPDGSEKRGYYKAGDTEPPTGGAAF